MTAPWDKVGPSDPAPGSPARTPGGIRRTSSIDTHPRQSDDVSTVRARGRDIRTPGGAAPTKAPVVLESVSLDIGVGPDDTIVTFAGEPAEPALDALLGASPRSGFRRRLAEVLADHAGRRTLLHLLLDDLPAARLVSGYATQRADPESTAVSPAVRGHLLTIADVCAGWARDATILTEVERTGAIPTTIGPRAPVLERPGDPNGWHPMAPLPTGSMRRRRRLDIAPGSGDHADTVLFDSHFRDSYAETDTEETVVHEYSLSGTIDRTSGTITSVVAHANVLPYTECPLALDSAQRLVGADIGGLRDQIRTEFVGATTCTHLNDTMRSLADISALLPHLR